MAGMIERLPGWPTLPDLFGWVEAGFPGRTASPGCTAYGSRST